MTSDMHLNAQDLVSPKLSNHHQQVAYLAFRLSERMDLTIEQQYDIFIASLIHDMGALPTRERLELIETEPVTVNSHAFRERRCLKGLSHCAAPPALSGSTTFRGITGKEANIWKKRSLSQATLFTWQIERVR